MVGRDLLDYEALPSGGAQDWMGGSTVSLPANLDTNTESGAR
jgi:hypothetical protein